MLWLMNLTVWLVFNRDPLSHKSVFGTTVNFFLTFFGFPQYPPFSLIKFLALPLHKKT